MTTLEIVLSIFQSCFFIVAGSWIDSQNKKAKSESKGGLIVLFCGVIGLCLSLAILVFYY